MYRRATEPPPSVVFFFFFFFVCREADEPWRVCDACFSLLYRVLYLCWCCSPAPSVCLVRLGEARSVFGFGWGLEKRERERERERADTPRE
ncbi:hypothetical protein IWX49DRAFT_197492 [Phyllosticta citricarpa]